MSKGEAMKAIRAGGFDLMVFGTEEAARAFVKACGPFGTYGNYRGRWVAGSWLAASTLGF